MPTPVVDRIKLWAFPGVISILAAIIWQDVKEIKSDVKELIAQSAIDKTRIDNLEREVFGNKMSASLPEAPSPSIPETPLAKVFSMVASKPEEEYSYKYFKKLPNTSAL
jgi:hypothetical protein